MYSSSMMMGSRKRDTMYDILNRYDYTSNLKLCLDAADHNSWNGSGGKWLDRSGGGYDFFLGTTTGSDSTDPTFGGSEMGSREGNSYFTFDGGDYFQYDTTNESWMNDLHKNGKKYTIATWIYLPNLTNRARVASTGGSSNPDGFNMDIINSTGELYFETSNSSGNGGTGIHVQFFGPSSTTRLYLTTGWNFVGVSLDLSDAFYNYWYGVVNSSSDSDLGTTKEFTTANANGTMKLGMGSWHTDTGMGGGSVSTYYMPSNTRIGSFCVWTGGFLTIAQLQNIFTNTRGWYGV